MRAKNRRAESVQGPPTNPPFPPAPVPTPASFLHFRFRPATQARPTYNQSGAGLVEPQFRHEAVSSGHVATFLRANRDTRSTPGLKPHPPRGSEWLSPGGAGKWETANGRREAGSGPKRGGGAEKRLQGRRGGAWRRPRAGHCRVRPGGRGAFGAGITGLAERVLEPTLATWRPLEMPPSGLASLYRLS